MQKWLAGAIAGTTATAPMTVAMKALQQRAPSARRRAIPPREITRELARRAGLPPRRNGAAEDAATTASHFGYGGAIGALYPYTAAHLPAPTLVRGALFGAGVWAVSYLGWLPAAGILRPATREPAGRNAMMIGAHLVWGVATALLAVRLAQSEADGEEGDAEAGAPSGPA
ncbi:MAG TPA: DUF6789 family protein [Myxococcota bacterium]|nr:DUF6789 family protein [Myxococcota bacterium]